MRILLPVFAAVYLLLVSSCIKNNNDETPPILTWRMDGGTEYLSDSTSLLSLFGIHSIFGKKGTTSLFVSTNSTNPGTYSPFTASAGFGLTVAGVQYGTVSGTVIINSSADRHLQGSFSSVMVNGTIDTIDLTGSFSNIRY